MFIEIIDNKATGAWSDEPQEWATFEIKSLPEKELCFYKVINNQLVYDEELENHFNQIDKNNNEIKILENYLKETDWYSIRFSETGKNIPNEIKTKRQEARDRISQLKKTQL